MCAWAVSSATRSHSNCIRNKEFHWMVAMQTANEITGSLCVWKSVSSAMIIDNHCHNDFTKISCVKLGNLTKISSCLIRRNVQNKTFCKVWFIFKERQLICSDTWWPSFSRGKSSKWLWVRSMQFYVCKYFARLLISFHVDFRRHKHFNELDLISCGKGKSYRCQSLLISTCITKPEVPRQRFVYIADGFLFTFAFGFRW